MTGTTVVTAAPGTPFVEIERTFDAPPERVFAAHADPELVARWLGPDRMSMRVERWETVDGGRWRFVHVDTEDPAGTEYGFHGVFHGTPSVGDGLLWTFEFEGAPGHVSLEHVAFEPAPGGGTTLRVHAVHQSVEARDAMIAAGMEGGLDEGHRRLDGLLAAARVR